MPSTEDYQKLIEQAKANPGTIVLTTPIKALGVYFLSGYLSMNGDHVFHKMAIYKGEETYPNEAFHDKHREVVRGRLTKVREAWETLVAEDLDLSSVKVCPTKYSPILGDGIRHMKVPKTPYPEGPHVIDNSRPTLRGPVISTFSKS